MTEATEMSDAVVSAQLAILSKAARHGASRDDVGRLAAQMRGEPMIVVQELDGGPVHVKVGTVRNVGPDYRGGAVLEFDVPPQHPKRLLVVTNTPAGVVQDLRGAGWKH